MTLHFVLGSLVAQLKAAIEAAAHEGEQDQGADEWMLVLPPAPPLHLLHLISQLLEQLKKRERRPRGSTKQKQKRDESKESPRQHSDPTTTNSKRVTLLGPNGSSATPAGHIFHPPTPSPLPVSQILQRVGDHLRGMGLPPFVFPSSLPPEAFSSPSPPSPFSPTELQVATLPSDVCLSLDSLFGAIGQTLGDKPMPGTRFIAYLRSTIHSCILHSTPSY